MLIANKEIIYFSFLSLFSLTVMSFGGIYSGANERVLFHSVSVKNVNNLIYDEESVMGEAEYVFKGGYLFHQREAEKYSSFYDGKIGFIRTSDYWRFPVNTNDAVAYLIGENNNYSFQLKLKSKNHLPVVSILADPDDFFSYGNGIYIQGSDADFISSAKFYPFAWHKPANFTRAVNDKRKVHFSFYDVNGKSCFQSYVYAEISGNATRCFPQKSLRITADKNLGSKKLNHSFFKSKYIYKTLVLRNGGNDNTKSLFRDMLMQEVMSENGLTVSEFLPFEMYLNSEYWGIHFLQNRMDEDFIAERYDVKSKNVTIAENWKIAAGSETEINHLNQFVTDKNLSYERIKEEIDVSDFIRFLIGELFFANTDWPENNLKMFKITGKKESKWKFAFFDLDYGFGYTGDDAVNTDMFHFLMQKNDPFSKMFKICMENDEFKKTFKSEFEIFLSENLAPSSLKKKIIEIKKQLSPCIDDHTMRWQKPASMEQWETEVERLNDFAEARSGVLKRQIEKYLN